MNWYFAYGSNMNPARMQARGLSVVEALPGRLPGYGLCFNKRAMDRAPGRAYANIRHQRDAVVEGVLYRLQDADEIAKLDQNRLVPGMPADVHFKTIDRTALSYLVKPVWDQMERAFYCIVNRMHVLSRPSRVETAQ